MKTCPSTPLLAGVGLTEQVASNKIRMPIIKWIFILLSFA
jgi:hypothetical protein